jgi:hypothetical protein
MVHRVQYLRLGPLDVDEFTVPYALLRHLICLTKRGGVEGLAALTLHIGEGEEELASGGLRNPLQVLLLAAAHL